MTNLKKKLTVLSLCGILATSAICLPTASASATARRDAPAITELSSHHNHRAHDDWERDHRRPTREKKNSGKHSTGELWTAGIVGAVIGAVIAKNT